jgi:hypothetical protein
MAAVSCFPSLRVMRANIWRALLCASDTEITEGMSFYEGASGLCRFVSQALTGGTISVRQVAGIYAALSPMNGWETNVANMLTVVKWASRDQGRDCKCDEPWPELLDFGFVVCERCGQQHSIHTNTSKINQRKAHDIAAGTEPLDVLGGRKVRAFFQAIVDPTDTLTVPVDRHLICLALGAKITSNLELRSFAGSRQLYSRIEQAYTELGARENLGNRLASIAWFVQRRVASGQSLLPHPGSPFCCSRPMQSFGRKPRRFYCPVCNDLRLVPYSGSATRFVRPPIAYLDGFAITQARDPHTGQLGRKRIVLGKSHPFANRAGWQYLARYLVMKETGQRLRPDEHTDHIDLDKQNDQLSNLRVMLAERHGKHHVYLAELAGGRGPDGKFIVYKNPIDLTTDVPF